MLTTDERAAIRARAQAVLSQGVIWSRTTDTQEALESVLALLTHIDEQDAKLVRLGKIATAAREASVAGLVGYTLTRRLAALRRAVEEEKE